MTTQTKFFQDCINPYRFGYQGSEKEVGVSGMYTTDYRALDTRLGRWFSPDPMTHVSQSPYCSMDNNPIALTDVMGLETGGDNVGSAGDPPITTTTEGCAYEDNGPHVGLPNGGDMGTVSAFGSFVFAYQQTNIPSIPKLTYEELPAPNVASDCQQGDVTTFLNGCINVVNAAIALQNKVLHPVESVQIELSQTHANATGTAKFFLKTGEYIGQHTMEEMVTNFFKAQAEWLTSSWSPASNETREMMVTFIITMPIAEFGGAEVAMGEISTAGVELGGAPVFEVIAEEDVLANIEIDILGKDIKTGAAQYEVSIDGNVLDIMVESAVNDGNTLTLNSLDIQGASANDIGVKRLFDIARKMGKQAGVKEVIINGNVRNSGKFIGKIPSPIRIKIN